MAVPPFLGSIGFASDDSGAVSSLSFTVTSDVAADPHNRVVFYVVTVPGVPFPSGGSAWSGFLSDDQPDPGGTGQPGNLYAAAIDGVGGSRIYAEGFPLSAITAGQELFLASTALMGVDVAQAVAYWGYTIGTTVTLTFGVETPAYAAIVGYAFTAVDVTDVAQLLTGTIDPTNTETGDGSLTPLGDVPFSIISSLATSQVPCIVCSDSVHGDISDPSGNWDPLDGDTSAGTGANWVTFLVDGSTVDPTEAIVQFETSIDGTTITDRRIGVNVYQLPVFTPPPPLAGIPIFNNHIRLSE